MVGDDRINTVLPRELSVRLQSAYGELFPVIEEGCRALRPVTLRVNACKTTSERVREQLSACGIAVYAADWYEDALIVENVREDALRETALYRNGEIYLQSLSSMLPPTLLCPQAGENILDMTAAPGGKTTQLYALSGGKALITACERDAGRYERLQYNLEKQGATRVNAVRRDALTLDDGLKFDKILLDAPCTGTGTVCAGSKIRFSEEYLARCVRLQEKLLDKALRLLRKGGTLLYSTCSVLPEEDGHIAEHALRRGAKLLPVELPAQIPALPSPQGTACVCPSGLYEGFFLAMFTV